MLTLIARGCKAMLSRERGVFFPLAGLVQQAPEVPRRSGEPMQLLSPRAVAAVARHRRP